MAVYKVPQDVEADDKLIGPFSFRQFIYLIIVAAAGAIAWVLGNLFIPLAIIPMPIILFFGALALPLRKDQPMETYLAAIVSFYIKPHKRLWDPDGLQSLIEITAPKVAEVQRSNGLSGVEAEQRLSYLANIVDSRGWSVRGVDAPVQTNSAMNTDVYFEAQQVEDVLDDSNRTAHLIGSQLDQTAAKHHQDLMNQMHQPVAPSPTQPQVQAVPVVAPHSDPAASPQAAQPQPEPDPQLTINPYPAMQQSVLQPISAPEPALPEPPKTTSEKQLSPDIMNLANNPDLSIATIAHEANRIKQKQGLPDEEVVISLH